jgi:hypothetical protein
MKIPVSSRHSVSVCEDALLFSGVSEKGGDLLAAHVLLQNLRLGAQQVDDDQAVDDATETLVDVEASQASAEPELLP